MAANGGHSVHAATRGSSVRAPWLALAAATRAGKSVVGKKWTEWGSKWVGKKKGWAQGEKEMGQVDLVSMEYAEPYSPVPIILGPFLSLDMCHQKW